MVRDSIRAFPSRIRYYLLEWKDENMNEYIGMFDDASLNDLTLSECIELYKVVVECDAMMMASTYDIYSKENR